RHSKITDQQRRRYGLLQFNPRPVRAVITARTSQGTAAGVVLDHWLLKWRRTAARAMRWSGNGASRATRCEGTQISIINICGSVSVPGVSIGPALVSPAT